jgi:hypothetical protein
MDTDTRRTFEGILWGCLFGAALWGGIILAILAID